MKHLGRFFLAEPGTVTVEGYTLMQSSTHKMTGSFEINDNHDNHIGIAEVTKIAEKYYLDVYENFYHVTIRQLMKSGYKKFLVRGNAKNVDRGKVYTYITTEIILANEIGSNFEVDRYSVLINADLNSSAFETTNWFKSPSPI